MSYVQKTLSEKKEYLVLQMGECRSQLTNLKDRESALESEIGELRSAIDDIDSALLKLESVVTTDALVELERRGVI